MFDSTFGRYCLYSQHVTVFPHCYSDYEFGSTRTKLQVSTWTLGLLISLLLIYSVGIVDDLIGLDAKIKFAVQIIAASILPACGLYINNLYGLFGIYEIPFI